MGCALNKNNHKTQQERIIFYKEKAEQIAKAKALR